MKLRKNLSLVSRSMKSRVRLITEGGCQLPQFYLLASEFVRSWGLRRMPVCNDTYGLSLAKKINCLLLIGDPG
jgi:hypothetical protein